MQQAPRYHDVSIVGLLSPEDDAFCRRLSSDMKLGFGEFIPHITIIGSRQRAADEFLTVLAGLRSEITKFTIQGVYFRLEEAKSRIWVGLTVRKDAQMIELFTKLATKLGLNVDVEEFFPHISLGCLTPNDMKNINLSALATARTTQLLVGCRLAVAQNGEYGKVTEIL